MKISQYLNKMSLLFFLLQNIFRIHDVEDNSNEKTENTENLFEL